jgi:hypothetical protein
MNTSLNTTGVQGAPILYEGEYSGLASKRRGPDLGGGEMHRDSLPKDKVQDII